MEQLDNDKSFKYPVRSVKFAFFLVEILARGKMEYSIAELMKESHLCPKGTVLPIVGNLEISWLYSTHRESRKYYLTYKFSKIGIAMNERIHILRYYSSYEKIGGKI